jgi:hypothetical protein
MRFTPNRRMEIQSRYASLREHNVCFRTKEICKMFIILLFKY